MPKRILSLAAATVFGLLAVIGLAPAAQAYPEVVIDISVPPTTVVGGEPFSVTANSNVTCDWTIEFEGQTRTDTSKEFTANFVAPEVTQITQYPLNGACDYNLPAGATPALRSTDSHWSRTYEITVVPAGQASPPIDDGSNGGKLPNTGGPSIWLLISGLVLAAAGAGAVVRSRSGKTA